MVTSNENANEGRGALMRKDGRGVTVMRKADGARKLYGCQAAVVFIIDGVIDSYESEPNLLSSLGFAPRGMVSAPHLLRTTANQSGDWKNMRPRRLSVCCRAKPSGPTARS